MGRTYACTNRLNTCIIHTYSWHRKRSIYGVGRLRGLHAHCAYSIEAPIPSLAPVCMYICMCVCVCEYIHAHCAYLRRSNSFTGACVYVCMCVCTCEHVHAHCAYSTEALIHSHAPVCVYVCMYVCVRARVNMYMHNVVSQPRV